MSCSNCALSVEKVLGNLGMTNIEVSFITGDVAFEVPAGQTDGLERARKEIDGLGYRIVDPSAASGPGKQPFLASFPAKFWFCFPFTALLMIGHWGMLGGLRFLHGGWWQLLVSLPVMVVGMDFFGRSAWKSIRKGVLNMNVLVALGAVSAFVYSLIGTIAGDESKLFYETAASIFDLVFLGNWMEHYSVAKTQQQIDSLAKVEKVVANMIAYDNEHNENIFPVENVHLRVGDLILIKTGEQVPMDCKVLSGEALVNEAIVSGESLPVLKKQGDKLIGGSVAISGSLKCYVTAVGKDTVLSGIVALLQRARSQKPPVHLLADKISAVFVPVVVALSAVAIGTNYWALGQPFSESLMRGIAVLVVSCPCAMGLATPAAIAVGLGRAAKNGILYARPDTLDLFKDIKQIVFDKTGTLTTGAFLVTAFQLTRPAAPADGAESTMTDSDGPMDESRFRKIVFSMEKYSDHPIAKSICRQWGQTSGLVKWKEITEIKGLGMKGIDRQGNEYLLGSHKIDASIADSDHPLYLLRNKALIGWIDIADEIRPEARSVIDFCKRQGMKTILLSGDSPEKCRQVADRLAIEQVYSGQDPERKLQVLAELCQTAPTIMVGDGINDAPALAKSTIGISLSTASQLAVQSASVVLMNGGLGKLPMAVQLAVHTYNTVRSNLFWAFFYNVIALPVAAIGWLAPAAGALLMGLSDVVLALNSLFLNFKKIGNQQDRD